MKAFQQNIDGQIAGIQFVVEYLRETFRAWLLIWDFKFIVTIVYRYGQHRRKGTKKKYEA